ncbi:A24 family peptidase [Mumia sp.]|uniref:prepilin peptidase n=1 Tax=Mumia sp. TaxID=1965300 RepID=UPI00262FC7DA|nr:A24 family peptidase [Mumia sp.]MDD9348406.1 A24 family peptidase [Mumia sp.]
MPEPLVAAMIAAVAAAVGGLVAPWSIARLPEPATDAAVTVPSARRKIPYAELAARPHLPAALAAVCAVLASALGWRLGLDPALPLWIGFIVLGVVLSSIDWHTHLLPKRLVLPAYPVALLLAGVVALAEGSADVLVRVAVGWAAVSGVYALLWFVAPRGIGYGDVRLSGLIAIALATLGWAELIVGAYAGFVLGAVGGVALAVAGLVDRLAFPFGPFMVLGAWSGAMWGVALLGTWG